jgi:hypothetical protein
MYMKNCASCNNKIKNSYTFCYECNNKKDNNSVCSSSSETIYKKESIPKTVRNCIWLNYFGNEREGKCQCCLRETISIMNFHAGHIKAEANGGTTTLDNLKPICMLCNCSTGKYDMHEFILKYNLHWGLKDNQN